MDLGKFKTHLEGLLDETNPSLEGRLQEALRGFSRRDQRSAVILLDWLDGLRECGRLDPLSGKEPGGSWFPRNYLEGDLRPRGNLARTRALIRWRRQGQGPALPEGQVLGQSRLLLLMNDGAAGACAWLSVTAFRPPEGREAEVALAPGSFFAVAENKDFRAVQQSLRPALATLFDGDAAGRARLEGTSFWLEVSPLRPGNLDPQWESLPAGSKERVELQLRAWSLAPGVLKVRGPSLGLPLGLAAWAAVRGLSCSSVLSTGKLDEDGHVSPVKALEEKASVIGQLLTYRATARRHRCCFVADDNRRAVVKHLLAFLPDFKAKFPDFKVEGIDYLAKAAKSPYFTDGFDDYRKKYLLLRSAQGLPQGTGLPHGPVYREGDAAVILRGGGPWLERLRGWQRGSTAPKAASDFRHLLAVPFGADPSSMAEHLEQELSRELFASRGRSGLQATELPVVIRAHLRELFDPDHPDEADLPKKLLPLIHQRSESRECDDAHLKNAFATLGKLIFVLHDDSSERLWNDGRVPDPTSARFAGKALGKLSGGALKIGDQRCEPQVVVIFCSDLHHKAALLGALPSQQPA